MSEEGSRNPAIYEGLASEPRLAQEVEALTMLHKLAMFSVGQAGLKPILSEIVDVAIAISGADFGDIQLLDAISSDLKSGVQRNFPQWWLDFWDKTHAGRGACGTALEMFERSPIFRGTLPWKSCVGQAYERLSPHPRQGDRGGGEEGGG